MRANEAAHAYFGKQGDDRDKPWAPHIICEHCCCTLEDWFRAQKRAMRFPIPRAWCAP